MYPYYETAITNEPFDFRLQIVENFNFPLHLHSHMELAYIVEGETIISVNYSKKELKKGDMVLCFPNDVHSYSSISDCKLMIIVFSPDIVRSYFSKCLGKTLADPFFEKDSFDEEINYLLNMLLAEDLKDRNQYVIKGLLYSIFGKLDKIFVFKDGKQLHDTTIQKLLRYIGSRFYENITLENTAKDLGFSKFHISRIFNHKIGEQFNDYINKLRINMAQSLLVTTDSNIATIALECGFESIRNFNRVFKTYSGMTPTEFRNSLKKQESV